jgi:hypothetical protein
MLISLNIKPAGRRCRPPLGLIRYITEAGGLSGGPGNSRGLKREPEERSSCPYYLRRKIDPLAQEAVCAAL